MADFEILGDLLAIFLVSVVVVALLQRVGIPTIAGFILAGTLIGPHALGLVGDPHKVEVLSEIGVALLLFGIGIELNLSRLRRLWRPLLVGGGLQVGITIAVVTLAAWVAGLPLNTAIFLGFIMAVSSTAIVLRGLEKRGEVEAPHGQLTLGMLIFQDICVVPMMLLLPVLAGSSTGTVSADLLLSMLKAAAVLVGVFLAAWVIAPRILHLVARTRQRDLFVLTVLLVCIGTAWIVSQAGISLALGAFLGGLVVAGSEYRHQAMSDLIPFREVLTSLFFVSIGMLLEPRVFLEQPGQVAGWLATILLGKFLIVFLSAAIMRLPARVCLLTGATLAQVGEFSFVLLHAVGDTGLLPVPLRQTLLPAVILSMLITPVLIAVGPTLALRGRLRLLARWMDFPTTVDISTRRGELHNHVIIAGMGVAGLGLARSLRAAGIPYIIVDLNPENIRRASQSNEPVFYGDISSPDVLEALQVHAAREIALLINDPRAAERAVVAIRNVTPHAHVLVRARYLGDVAPLLQAGASEVVPAEMEAAVEVTARVLTRHGVGQDERNEQIARIRQMDESRPLI